MLEDILLLLSSSSFGTLDTIVQKKVYREFYRFVYPVIFFLVQDHSTTEDIIQEAFLKTIKRNPVVRNENELKGWIKVVVRNTTYSYLKKNKKHRNLIDVEQNVLQDTTDYSTVPAMIEKEVEMKVMVEMIEGILKDLKPEYRALIEMRWRQDLSYRDIAETLGITEEVVKNKLHRAREAVKRRLGREWVGDYE